MVLSAELSAEWRDSGEAEGISLIERGRESKRSARDKTSKRVIVAARNLPKEADGRFVALAGPTGPGGMAACRSGWSCAHHSCLLVRLPLTPPIFLPLSAHRSRATHPPIENLLAILGAARDTAGDTRGTKRREATMWHAI